MSFNGTRKTQWLCQCDCGNETIVRGDNLKNKTTQSCGCLSKYISSKKLNKKYNTYNLDGKYGIGYTSKGEEFYFDIEDYEKIKKYTWWIDKDGYVITENNKKRLSLHRLITNCSNDTVVDHKYGEHTRNDNRKYNLRVCKQQNNMMNCKISKNNTSGVTGVVWDKRGNKWIAVITYNYKQIYLGGFNNFEDAVKARKEAEEKYFGEYSYDNSQRKVGDKIA